jgi:ABC-type sugar transport system permease subunit
MESDVVTSPQSANSDTQKVVRVVLGILLLLPAAWFLLNTLLLPSLQTISNSFQKWDIIRPPVYVGTDNYALLSRDAALGSALRFTLPLALGRIVAVAILPPLLALALSRFGRRVRVPIRLLFSLPLALFAPVLTLVSWRIALNPQIGLFQSTSTLGNVNTAPTALIAIDALTTFGLACGVGLVVYLIALRDSAFGDSQSRRPLLVVWIVMLLAAFALALQSFALSYVLTGGGPGRSTETLGTYYYGLAFRNFNGGLASTIATVLLVILGLLGVLVTLVLIVSGLRLETMHQLTDADLPDWSIRQRALPVLILVGLLCLILVAAAILPVLWVWLARPSFRPGGVQQPITLASIQDLLNLFVPAALPILLIQLPVAYFAALGIGALRPLGRYSEWLLLIASPFLFVTILPLSLALFQNARTASLVNTEAALTIPRVMLSVPMLFVLTIFFKGQARQWSAAQAAGRPALSSFFTTVILPSLPLAVLLGLAVTAVSAMDLLWPLIAVNSRDLQPLPVRLILLSATAANTDPIVVELIRYGVPLFVLSLLVIALFQVFYFDRLALRTGDEPAGDLPPASPPM